MLREILSADRILLDLEPAPKGELLGEMTRRLAEAGAIADAAAVLDLLVKREAMVTTGVKRGFAFPHAFTKHAAELTLTVGVIRKGTDYESLDGEPVEFVFLLLGPPSRQDLHLRVLARLSRVATEAGMLEALRAATAAGEIANLLNESDRLIAADH